MELGQNYISDSIYLTFYTSKILQFFHVLCKTWNRGKKNQVFLYIIHLVITVFCNFEI